MSQMTMDKDKVTIGVRGMKVFHVAVRMAMDDTLEDHTRLKAIAEVMKVYKGILAEHTITRKLKADNQRDVMALLTSGRITPSEAVTLLEVVARVKEITDVDKLMGVLTYGKVSD